MTFLIALAGLGATTWVQSQGKARVERANTDLESTNAALEVARLAAVSSEEQALANEERALENEREARWQSYVANIGAANARLEAGSVGDAARRLQDCPEEYRGSWEWRHLENRVDASLARAAHGETFVHAVAISPDGEYVASGGGAGFGTDFGRRDHAVRIWKHDPETAGLTLLHVLPPHPNRVHSLAFSPSGTELASASARSSPRALGEVRVWDVETGEPLAALDCERGGGSGSISPTSIAYHPDHGRLRIAVGSISAVWEWDFSGDELHEIQPTKSAVTALAYSPNADEAHLVAGFHDGSVVVLDRSSEDAVELARFDLSTYSQADISLQLNLQGAEQILDLAWSSDGRRLAAATMCGDLVLLDLALAEITGVLRGHTRPATAVRFGAGDRSLVSCSFDGTLRLWDLETSQSMEVLHGHADLVTSLALGPDGHRVVSGSSDGTVRVWDGQAGSSTSTMPSDGRHSFNRFALCFGLSGNRLAWRPTDRGIRVTDLESGLDLFTLRDSDRPPVGFAFDPSGETLITVVPGAPLRRWSATDGRLVSAGEIALPRATYAPRFDTNCERFVVPIRVDQTSYIQVRDAVTGALLEGRDWAWPCHYQGVRFTPDGERLVVGDNEGTITVLDANTGETLRAYDTQLPSQVRFLAVSPDGAQAAVTSWTQEDHAIWLFDLHSDDPPTRMEGHAKPAQVTYSPDGQRMLSANWHDGTISLWAPGYGELLSLHGHVDTVQSVAFSPDGARIASIDADGTHRVWETAPVSQRAAARRRAAAERGFSGSLAPRVDALFDEHMIVDDVVQALRRASDLPPDRLEAAIRLARNRSLPSPDSLRITAWTVVRLPGLSPERYERALRETSTAQRLSTNNYVVRDAMCNEGYALYRLGRYDEAFELLTSVYQLNYVTDPMPYPPYDLIGIAMAEHRLGRQDEAAATLARAAAAEMEMFPAQRAQIRRLMAEAESLMNGE